MGHTGRTLRTVRVALATRKPSIASRKLSETLELEGHLRWTLRGLRALGANPEAVRLGAAITTTHRRP